MNLSERLLNLLGVHFWIAFGAAAILANPVWRLLLLTKSRQTISEYAPEGHQLKQGTPTMGGIIIVLGYLVSAVSYYFSKGLLLPIHFRKNILPAFLLLMVGFALIGFVDDFVVPRFMKGKRGLGWKQKIAMQFGLAILGTGICFGWTFNYGFAASVVLILFFSNAYNFSDGLDGLAGTLLLGLVVGVVGICLLTAQMNLVSLMVIPLAGAVIPFLFLNAPPARVFMGDVGSLPIGATIGMAVACLTLEPAWSLSISSSVLPAAGSWAVLLACLVVSLMMIVELVPVPLQIASVKLRKKKLFPYTPIHHAFEKAGWPESRVVWMFALIQLLASLLALFLLFVSIPFPELK